MNATTLYNNIIALVRDYSIDVQPPGTVIFIFTPPRHLFILIFLMSNIIKCDLLSIPVCRDHLNESVFVKSLIGKLNHQYLMFEFRPFGKILIINRH